MKLKKALFASLLAAGLVGGQLLNGEHGKGGGWRIHDLAGEYVPASGRSGGQCRA